MCALEQIISNTSLDFVEKRLLFEAIKVKRKTKNIMFNKRTHYLICKGCEKAYNQILSALLQLYEYQKPF